MKPWISNILVGGTLFLEVWLNGAKLDLAQQHIMLNNSPAAIPVMELNNEPHNNLILTLKTIPSPPGPVCPPPGYTFIESSDGTLGLEQVISILQTLASGPEKE